MSDLDANPNVQEAPMPTLTDEQIKTIQDQSKAMQDMRSQFFSPDQLDVAGTAITAASTIVSNAKGKIVYNFDPAKGDIHDGYSIIINPIKQRDKKTGKSFVVGVTVGAIPTYEILSTTDDGMKYIRDIVNNSIVVKLANSARPNANDEISTTLPYEVVDFITSNRAEGVLLAYRKYAPKYIKVLKSKGFKDLTDATFRQVLQSTAFANSTFPNVPQEVWLNIINGMGKLAVADGIVVGMLEDWVKTRDTAGMPEEAEIVVDDLMDLVIS